MTACRLHKPPGWEVRLAAVSLLPLLFGCGGRDEAPNLVVVTLDTTRKDCVSTYGGGWVNTPCIDRLAAEGIVLEGAVCPIPMTRPSHASLFTGRYPRSLGLENNTYPLTDRWPTLATILEEKGYSTGAVVSTGLFGAKSGFSRGFSRYAETSVAEEGETARKASEFLGEAAREGRPFFLWVHFFDPHFPYKPPQKHHPGEAGAYGEIPVATRATLAQMTAQTGGDVTAAMLRRVRDLYGGEVAYVDEQVCRLAEKIDALGLDEKTLLIVVSDHGESFDHRFYFNHDRVLYESTVAVAAILRWPGSLSPGRLRGPVEMIDLGPTVLDLLGIEPPPSMEGRSLAAHLEKNDLPERPVFFTLPAEVAQEFLETTEGGGRRKEGAFQTVLGEVPRDRLPHRMQIGVIQGDWKLIAEEGEPAELYFLADDPLEERNVLARWPEKGRELLGLIREWEGRHPRADAVPEEATEEAVERLRALGYVE